ncbi:hypothetical protein M422DRAFT_192480 [Sphaerobolus stellatus SS14]|uniref:Uncharacterized protein n=1 Tax=Sphaerobolus stellatus (strain SS14) TaxID=990650 RepID=A0A0C9ULU5_SPHS4|nr:hypothetical protein M422DRAFT_192480 [Sphaerobolus stellatus SS14]
MNIETLLNPAGESCVMEESTDQDIYQAVINAIEARENAETNGGDDVDIDVPVETRPTYREVIQAASLISRYLGSVNSPSARQLEGSLDSFRCQLRSEQPQYMKSTTITNYFTSKARS